MAKLINGNGNKAIWAAQDADLIASICGNITSIAAVGSQFSYTQEDANTIGVSDGVIITKEGRRIQLDTGSIDLFTIPTGLLGATSYYIIGYKLVQTADTVQTCETFVQKMDNSTDVITEDTFKGGATEVYVSIYRVTQVGMNIDTVDLLLPKISDLTDKVTRMSGVSGYQTVDVLGYNPTTNKLGLKVNGADTVIPFSSGDVAEIHVKFSITSGVGYITQSLYSDGHNYGDFMLSHGQVGYANSYPNLYSISLTSSSLTLTLKRTCLVDGISRNSGYTITFSNNQTRIIKPVY